MQVYFSILYETECTYNIIIIYYFDKNGNNQNNIHMYVIVASGMSVGCKFSVANNQGIAVLLYYKWYEQILGQRKKWDLFMRVIVSVHSTHGYCISYTYIKHRENVSNSV